MGILTSHICKFWSWETPKWVWDLEPTIFFVNYCIFDRQNGQFACQQPDVKELWVQSLGGTEQYFSPQPEKQAASQTNSKTAIQTDRHTSRKTNRYIDRETYRQWNRQTARQTDIVYTVWHRDIYWHTVSEYLCFWSLYCYCAVKVVVIFIGVVWWLQYTHAFSNHGSILTADVKTFKSIKIYFKCCLEVD